MKSLLIAAFALLLLISCNSKDPKAVRYTQEAPEIEIIKARMFDFEKGNWKGFREYYADTAKIFHNADKEMTLDILIVQNQKNTQGFEAYGFKKDGQELERVVTDAGETWVNLWTTYQVKPIGIQDRIDIPMSVTFQFVKGKIVKEYGYWDNAPLMNAMTILQDSTNKVIVEDIKENISK